VWGGCAAANLCSSCFTSTTVPSWKDHLTMSVSSLAALTYSLLLIADQNLLKSCEEGSVGFLVAGGGGYDLGVPGA